MKLDANDRLLMIGDSITDCDRARPIGEGRAPSTGHGYVAIVEALLQSVYSDYRIRVTNMGISGNTVRDLDRRWATDVLALNPDWVSIMIGINDVWRQFDTPTLTEGHVYPDEYEQTLDQLVSRTKPHVKGIVLMTPFYIEPNRADAMRQRMDEYGAIVKKIASKHDTLFVDTQAALDRVTEHIYPAAIAWDRVHPSMTGHMVLARAFLEALDFAW